MNPAKEAKIKFLAPLFLILGVYLCTQSLPRVLEVRALAEGLDLQTEAVDGECDANNGGLVDIVVEGERYPCSVPDKCGTQGMLVAYDGSDPARCRAADAVGKIGRYEGLSLLGALAMLSYGVIATIMVLVRRRRKAAEIEAIVAEP